MGVAEDLDLDVARPGDVALEEHSVVAEAARRLAPGRGDRVGQVAGRLDDPHALAAAAGGRLDEQRVADLAVGGRVVGRAQGRDAGLDRRPLGGQLVAHGRDDVGRRPDPGQPGRRDLGANAAFSERKP